MAATAGPLPTTPSASGAPGARSTVSLTAVIPVKDEGPTIGWVLRRLPPDVDEVILVDGHSTDDTVARALAARPDVVVITEGAPGKGAALLAGFVAARGEIVVMLDGDGSMDPAEIPRLVAAVRDGADLAKGSRFLTGAGTADMTRVRRAGNRLLLALVNARYRVGLTDLCYGFCAFRRDRLAGLSLTATGFEIETQIVSRALRRRLTIAEVPSFEAARRAGESHLRTGRDGFRVLRTLLREAMAATPNR